jgi:WD40 repeat protein
MKGFTMYKIIYGLLGCLLFFSSTTTAQTSQDITNLSYSQSGNLIAAFNRTANSVIVWDLTGNVILETPVSSHIYNWRTNDQLMIYYNEEFHVLNVIDPQLQIGQEILSYPFPSADYFNWSPDELKLITYDRSNKLQTWRINSTRNGFDLASEIISEEIYYVVWHPNSEHIALVQNGLPGIYNAYNLLGGALEFTRLPSTSASWSPDGKYLAMITLIPRSLETKLTIYDVAQDFSISQEFFLNLEEGSYVVQYISWSPDGGRIALGINWFTENRFSHVQVLDVQTGNVLETYNRENFFSNFAWSPDGVHMAMLGQTGSALPFEIVTPPTITPIATGTPSATPVELLTSTPTQTATPNQSLTNTGR